jgi:hypothetical protein
MTGRHRHPHLWHRKKPVVFILWRSIPNSFHIFEQNLLTAAVIEFRGSAVGVTGNALHGFKVPSFSRKFVIPVARNE